MEFVIVLVICITVYNIFEKACDSGVLKNITIQRSTPDFIIKTKAPITAKIGDDDNEDEIRDHLSEIQDTLEELSQYVDDNENLKATVTLDNRLFVYTASTGRFTEVINQQDLEFKKPQMLFESKTRTVPG